MIDMKHVYARLRDNGLLSKIKIACCVLMLYMMFSTFFFSNLHHGNLVKLVVNTLLFPAHAAFLCYAVMNIEKLAAKFKSSANKQGWAYALYFSVHMVLLFNLGATSLHNVTSFNRVFGAALVSGVDVSKRISAFNHSFIYVPVLFALYLLLANYFLSKEHSEENRKVISFLNNVIVIANVVQFIGCIHYVRFLYSVQIVFALMLLCVAYIIFDFEKKISTEQFLKLILCVWMISYFIAFCIPSKSMDKSLTAVQVLLFIIAFFTIKTMNFNWNSLSSVSSLTTMTICLSLIPFLTSFYIELICVLNQHRIFIAKVHAGYVVIGVLGLLLSCWISRFIGKKGAQIENWKSFVYPCIIFGIVCLMAQAPISKAYNADMFESANMSILISDFLNFGDIPIVQHYGGHMMRGVWEGIIYGWLNNDYLGAIFSPYAGYATTVIAIAMFFVLSHVWDKDTAFFALMFFPFINYLDRWGMGLLTCLAVMAFVRKNTYVRAFAIWLACAWCSLYRLDLGFAFICGCIAALLIYVIHEKNTKAAKQLLIALAITGCIGMSIWVAICIAKGVDPINRLMEFVLISMSNKNWAYASIGDDKLITYAWVYTFLPYAVVFGLIWSTFSASLKKSIKKEVWVLLLLLGFAFIYNYSRGLVRHSMAEKWGLATIRWTSYIFLALFLASFKKNMRTLLPVLCLFIVLDSLFLNGNKFTYTAISDSSLHHIGQLKETWHKKDYWKKLEKKREVIDRVKFSDKLMDSIEGYKLVTDALLEDSETYVDFINKTFSYSAINRRNPVYVSQSPLQLSGQFTQEMFVEEIKGVPIVLMPVDASNSRCSEGLDGIANSYRYYKVAEYIYQNYVPLCKYRDVFAVWCLPERFDGMRKKIEALSEQKVDIREGVMAQDKLKYHSVKAERNSDGSVSLKYTTKDPYVVGLQNLFDITPYINKEIDISIEYKTDVGGAMEIFYTTDEKEKFTGAKRKTVKIKDKGVARYKIPITAHSKLRLDTPEGSNVRIQSFTVNDSGCEAIDYGYDGPYTSDGGKTYKYLPYLHNYDIKQLPLIWAEMDKRHSSQNPVLMNTVLSGEYYTFDLSGTDLGTAGNYIKTQVNCTAGMVLGKNFIDATLKLGHYSDGKFETKCIYKFKLKRGKHEYMFRVSNDYYWHLKEVNAARLECEKQLQNVKMSILQGD